MKSEYDEKSKDNGVENHFGRRVGKRVRSRRFEGLSDVKSRQVFYADYAKPEGFCDEAWKAIYQYVFALSHGAGETLFYYGDWIRKPGVAICSCNDGLRPVIFKLEATEEESVIDYTPVR